MANEKFQAWLAGYARGGENEAARAVQAYTAFFGAPAAQVGPAYATGAQHGPVFAEDGVASVRPELGPDGPYVGNWMTFPPGEFFAVIAARLVECAAKTGKPAATRFAGSVLRAYPGDTVEGVERRYCKQTTDLKPEGCAVAAGPGVASGASTQYTNHATVTAASGGVVTQPLAATSASPMAARSIAFEENTTLGTACEKLSALAARYNVAYEGKFAGKTLRANPGDKPQYLQHRFWNEP